TRLTHSIASSFDRTCHSQKPASSSLVSEKGPSTTVGFALPENRTRAPFELGCSPSPASRMPAFTNSSLNFPISASICSLARTPASESLPAFIRIMNFMVWLLSCGELGAWAGPTGTDPPGSTVTTNDRARDRQSGRHFFQHGHVLEMAGLLAS